VNEREARELFFIRVYSRAFAAKFHAEILCTLSGKRAQNRVKSALTPCSESLTIAYRYVFLSRRVHRVLAG
jgi:hypothetical protein